MLWHYRGATGTVPGVTGIPGQWIGMYKARLYLVFFYVNNIYSVNSLKLCYNLNSIELLIVLTVS